MPSSNRILIPENRYFQNGEDVPDWYNGTEEEYFDSLGYEWETEPLGGTDPNTRRLYYFKPSESKAEKGSVVKNADTLGYGPYGYANFGKSRIWIRIRKFLSPIRCIFSNIIQIFS